MKILVSTILDLKRMINNRHHHLLRYLCRHHEITALCTNAWWLEKRDGAGLKNTCSGDRYFDEMFQKVRIIYLTKPASPILEELSIKTFNAVLKEIDYGSFNVHLNQLSFIPGYFVAKKMSGLGIPTVLDVYDDAPEMIRVSPQVPYLLRPLGGIVARLVFKKNVEMATRITFTVKTLSDSYNFPEDKSVLVPNGVDTELFHYQPSQTLKSELGLEQDFVLGFVGILLDWVDLKPVFSALKELGRRGLNVKMLVIGGGPTLQKNRDIAQSYGILDRVIFTGNIPYSQVPRHLCCTDVCLICRTSRQDSQSALPIKLFEYMACQRPVISTKLAGVIDAVKDRVLYASSGEDFKNRIMELYHNEGLRGKLGQQGRRFVEQNYSWSEICRKFEEVLLETASAPR